MKVLFATSEAAPFVKTGGLGDVAGSLPAALNEKGVDARVILPLYNCIPQEYKDKMNILTISILIWLGENSMSVFSSWSITAVSSIS